MIACTCALRVPVPGGDWAAVVSAFRLLEGIGQPHIGCGHGVESAAQVCRAFLCVTVEYFLGERSVTAKGNDDRRSWCGGGCGHCGVVSHRAAQREGVVDDAQRMLPGLGKVARPGVQGIDESQYRRRHVIGGSGLAE